MTHIYTDGSCLVPQGPSGWAYAVVDGNYIFCDSGGVKNSTNNRMELEAVIMALRFVVDNSIENCTIFSDSQLILNCAQKLWKRNKNLDLWKDFDNVHTLILEKYGKNTITWTWVKGHSGDKYNDLVDSLAKNAAKKERSKN